MGFFDFINDIFGSSEEESSADDMITVDVTDYGWTPHSDEIIISAHLDCHLMKNGGKIIGEAFGKVHSVAQEMSSQRLICCVTNKHIVLISQDNKEKTKIVLTVGSKVVGLDWISRKIALKILLSKWLEYSAAFNREDVLSA